MRCAALLRAVALAACLAAALTVAQPSALSAASAKEPLGLVGADAQALGPEGAEELRRLTAPFKQGWQFAHFYGKYNQTLEAALDHIHLFSKTLVVVVPGREAPRRRSENQALLQIFPTAAGLPLDEINAALELVERALGRRLFPLSLFVTNLRHSDAPAAASQRIAQEGQEAAGDGSPGGFWTGPYVIYEVSSGTVLLDGSIFERLGRSAVEVRDTVSNAAAKFYESLATAAGASAAAGGLAGAQTAAAAAAGAAVAALGAATVPLWFCIACPMVLGLAVPLVINFGLGEVGAQICSHMHLPDEQCFDLMLGILAVAMVLSLASALPIFKVCRMYQCEHRRPQPPWVPAVRL